MLSLSFSFLFPLLNFTPFSYLFYLPSSIITFSSQYFTLVFSRYVFFSFIYFFFISLYFFSTFFLRFFLLLLILLSSLQWLFVPPPLPSPPFFKALFCFHASIGYWKTAGGATGTGRPRIYHEVNLFNSILIYWTHSRMHFCLSPLVLTQPIYFHFLFFYAKMTSILFLFSFLFLLSLILILFLRRC